MSGFFVSQPVSPATAQSSPQSRHRRIDDFGIDFYYFFSFPWDVGLFFSRSPNPSVGFLTRTAG